MDPVDNLDVASWKLFLRAVDDSTSGLLQDPYSVTKIRKWLKIDRQKIMTQRYEDMSVNRLSIKKNYVDVFNPGRSEIDLCY